MQKDQVGRREARWPTMISLGEPAPVRLLRPDDATDLCWLVERNAGRLRRCWPQPLPELAGVAAARAAVADELRQWDDGRRLPLVVCAAGEVVGRVVLA